MEKRYQVFVSSTYRDLIDERQHVIRALLELDCMPCGMEFFPARNEEVWEAIKELISACDYYVVIVGGKYGSANDIATSKENHGTEAPACAIRSKGTAGSRTTCAR